jgi:hypothetical protein
VNLKILSHFGLIVLLFSTVSCAENPLGDAIMSAEGEAYHRVSLYDTPSPLDSDMANVKLDYMHKMNGEHMLYSFVVEHHKIGTGNEVNIRPGRYSVTVDAYEQPCAFLDPPPGFRWDNFTLHYTCGPIFTGSGHMSFDIEAKHRYYVYPDGNYIFITDDKNKKTWKSDEIVLSNK